MNYKEIAERLFKRLHNSEDDNGRIFPHYEGQFITLVVDELEQLPTPAVDAEPELMEKLADIEHQRWSHWQKYMHSKMQTHKGDFIIPGILVEHWERQIKTAYKDLSEREKEEDRKQVRRYLPLLSQAPPDKEAEIERLKDIISAIKDNTNLLADQAIGESDGKQ